MGGVALPRLGEHLVVVARAAPDEHTAPAGRTVAAVARVLQARPRLLEKQPLLRLHRLGLDRGQGEERRVELVDPVQHGRPPAVRAVGHLLVRVEPGVDVPPGGGHVGDRTAALDHIAPERPHVGRVGKPAGDADHGDVVRSRAGCGRGGLPACRRHGGERHSGVAARLGTDRPALATRVDREYQRPRRPCDGCRRPPRELFPGRLFGFQGRRGLLLGDHRVGLGRRRLAARRGDQARAAGSRRHHGFGQGIDHRVVVDRRRVQVRAEPRVQPAHQLDRTDRVQAHVGERQRTVHFGLVEVEHGAQGRDHGVPHLVDLRHRGFEPHSRCGTSGALDNTLGGRPDGGFRGHPDRAARVLAHPRGHPLADQIVVQPSLPPDDLRQLAQRPSGQLGLERPHRGLRLRRDPVREVQRHRQHLRAGHHPHHRPATRQLSAAQRAAGQHQLGGDRRTEPPLQDVGRAHAGCDAVVHEGRAVGGVRGHHDHVAVQAEREPAARRVTLHRGHHGSVAAQQAFVQERLVGEPAAAIGQLRQLRQLRAHTEHRPVTGHHDRPDRRIGGDPREPLAQQPHLLRVEGRGQQPDQRHTAVQHAQIHAVPGRAPRTSADVTRLRLAPNRLDANRLRPDRLGLGRGPLHPDPFDAGRGLPAAHPASLLAERVPRQRHPPRPGRTGRRRATRPVDLRARHPGTRHLVQAPRVVRRDQVAALPRPRGAVVFPRFRLGAARHPVQGRPQRGHAVDHHREPPPHRLPTDPRHVRHIVQPGRRAGDHQPVHSRPGIRVAVELPAQRGETGRVEAEVRQRLRTRQCRLRHSQVGGDNLATAADRRAGLEVRADGPRLLPQRLLVLGGQHEQRGSGERRGALHLGRLLDHDVRVRPARAEGGDASRPPPALGTWPVADLPLYRERRAREVELWVELRRVQRRHQHAVPQLPDHLGQCGDAGGALQVADVGLHRPDRAPRRPGHALRRHAAGLPVRSGRPGRCRYRAPRRSRRDAGRHRTRAPRHEPAPPARSGWAR